MFLKLTTTDSTGGAQVRGGYQCNVALLQIYRLYLLYYTTVIEKLLFYHHQIKRTIFQRPSLKIAMETFSSIIASSFLSRLYITIVTV